MRRAKSIAIASAIIRTRQQEHARSKHGSAPAGHKNMPSDNHMLESNFVLVRQNDWNATAMDALLTD